MFSKVQVFGLIFSTKLSLRYLLLGFLSFKIIITNKNGYKNMSKFKS